MAYMKSVLAKCYKRKKPLHVLMKFCLRCHELPWGSYYVMLKVGGRLSGGELQNTMRIVTKTLQGSGRVLKIGQIRMT